MQVYSQSGHIDEEFVKYKALEFLQKRYRGGLFSANTVIALPEVYTVEGKRADGLAFYTSGRSSFTASLEAKSYSTLNVIKPEVDHQSFEHRRLIFWAIGGISYVFACILLSMSAAHITICWGLFLLAGDYAIFKTDHEKLDYYSSFVFRQMRQYPANEKWLAVAEDCFDDNKMTEEDLMKVCKKANVGLICVTDRGKIDVMVKPVKQFGNFLPYYSKDSRISGYLS